MILPNILKKTTQIKPVFLKMERQTYYFIYHTERFLTKGVNLSNVNNSGNGVKVV